MKKSKYIIGNYFLTHFGWRRFRDLAFLTRQWDAMCSDRTFGGGLSTRERDNYLKYGTCCELGCTEHWHRWPELSRVHKVA